MSRIINGNGKTAITRINEHEKLCRIMQRETFKKIDELSERIQRLEKIIMVSAGVIITSMGGLIVSLLLVILK
jgi:hypothetical protein